MNALTMNDMTLYLAKTTAKSAILANMGVVFLQLLFFALCLYLASQALMNLPTLRTKLMQPQNELLVQLAIIAAAAYLIFSLPNLRILHILKLAPSAKSFVWPDIIFSALALTRLSYLWHYLFRWLDRHSK